MPARVPTIIDRLEAPPGRSTIEVGAPFSFPGGDIQTLPVVQRQYLNTGETLEVGDEHCLIVAGSFRNDGAITFQGSGFLHVC